MKVFRVKDDLHKMVFDKREEIKEKEGLDITIESIVDKILRKGIQTFSLNNGKTEKKYE